MSVVNVHEAKTHLSKILERVARGEEIIIAKAGKPVARLVPITETRQPGRLKGVLRIGEGFDDPLPEQIARAFRGGDA